MVYRCEGNLHADLVIEILEHVIVKILGVVDYDLLWDSITTNDVLQYIFLMVAEVMLVTDFTSTHFVRYSTTIMVKV
jgi:hypothetical protein